MKRNFLETLIGFVVLIVASYFLYHAYSSTGRIEEGNNSYVLCARFNKADGLVPGGDVKISGIKIGKILALELDTTTFQAVAKFSISTDFKIPDDSSAKILSTSLLGDKYMSITPGASDEFLQETDCIEFTQSSVNIEDLIGKFMFGLDDEKKK